MPGTSFIVVNWNGEALLRECLDSLIGQSWKDFEIILVDNGSTDNSVALVRRSYPDVILVMSEYNRGFAGGNNLGLARATGDYIALVNNDAVLCCDWLRHMVMTLDQDDRLGCCASRIIISGTNQIDSVGDRFTSAFSGTKQGEFEPATDFSSPRPMHGVCAAAAIYRKTMLDEVGFFDEDFFLNHEDTDLNMRIWLAGWLCRYVPEAIAHHQVNRTIGTMSDTSVYHFSRNTVWAWIKNSPARFLFTHLPHRVLYEIFAAVYFCIVHRQWRPYLRGKWHAVIGIPRMVGKRASVVRRLSPAMVCRDLVPITGYLWQKIARQLHR